MAFFQAHIAAASRPYGTLQIRSRAGYYIVSNQDETILVRLRQRSAYPATFCQRVNEHAIHLGYGDATGQDRSEFLQITITDDGTFSMQRDRYAALPIFFMQSGSTLFLSNEYADVASQSKPVLSKAGLMELLAMDGYISRPIIEGISILQEGAGLTFEKGVLRTTMPPAKTWGRSAELPETDPQAFMSGFNAYLDHFIATRLAGQQFAFEVSGGLDSATLPQYLARVYHQKAPTVSMILPGEYGVSQMQKLHAIMPSIASATYTTLLDPKVHFPLGHMIRSGHIPHYYEKTYAEGSEALLEQQYRYGTRVIVTGTGGDEMFGNVVDPTAFDDFGAVERERRASKPLAPFLTSTFRSDYIAATPEQAVTHSLRPLSVIYSQLGNNLYIRHDLWPVSPFSDPELYEWVQGLPAYLRSNRNILRAYHQAYGFVESIYNPIKNEYFDRFFLDCFKIGCYDTTFAALLQNSVSVALGYVDKKKLLETYEHIKQATYPAIDDDCFRIYLWLSAEINAQCAVS